MSTAIQCAVDFSSLRGSVWYIDDCPSAFTLRVLKLSRVVSGRLVRGYEVHVRAQEDDNYVFWGSTDLLLSTHDILVFFERCVSEYLDRPVVADFPDEGIPNPYGGWLC